jgi:exopolyphosphatase/guanosine-5'-triphosphate,3'-diphosphate pyrophosphatase
MNSTRRFGPVGIIDIGSNSVRFVAYGGAARVPSSLFNEKITAALGKGIAKSGKLDEAAIERTLRTIARFRRLAREMGVKKLHTVATAAVRDASNGPAFLRQVSALGLKPRLLSGTEEAELAGLGVISGIPRANGVVADLGGGSLELVGVARGAAGEGVSLPLGVLRVGSSPDRKAIGATIVEAVEDTRLVEAAHGHSLYLVGGSFRALAQLDLRHGEHPLPIIHQHRLRPERVELLAALAEKLSPGELKERFGLSSTRAAAMPAATAILRTLMDKLQPRRVIVSAFGLREGLLYRELDEATRDQDPLLAAALEIGERLGRFGDHGAALDQWISPLFMDDDHDAKRLRLAACLLGDIAWNAHPDYRAERAVDLAIHGNWVGIDARGRAMLGRALCAAFGGESGTTMLATLLTAEEDRRAVAWGKAIRLAQRLSAGTEPVLRRTALSLKRGKIYLSLSKQNSDLYAEAVERRLQQLGAALGRPAEAIVS